MTEYIVLLIITFAIAWFYKGEKEGRYASLLLFAMMVMCGLRGYTVGTDTHNYVACYVNSDMEERFGFFYVYLMQICQKIGDSPTIFLMAMALLTYLPIIYIVNKRPQGSLLVAYCYLASSSMFFFETFNLSREMISISWILLFMFFMEEDKKKLALISIIIAVLTHKYAIISIPFVLFKKYELKKTYVVAGLMISAVVGMSGILDSITNTLLFISGTLGDGEFFSDFVKYATRDISSDWNIVGQLSHILPLSTLTFLCYTEDNKNDLFYKCLFWGTIILNLFVSVKYCERLASVLTISQILVVPTVLLSTKGSTQNMLIKILLAMFAGLYIYQLFVMGRVVQFDSVVPYSTFLDF